MLRLKELAPVQAAICACTGTCYLGSTPRWPGALGAEGWTLWAQ